jgi:hypothetical protein
MLDTKSRSSSIELPPLDEMGPRMQALAGDAQRRFVLALLQAHTPTAAARLAGYSDHKEAAKVRAHHLMQNADVLAALHEVSWKKLNGIAVRAIEALDRVVADPDNPKHLVAVQMVLDRTGFAAQTEHKVTVEHKVDDLQLKALAARFAHDTGVPMQKLLGYNNVVDGEFKEVADDEGGTTESGIPDKTNSNTD